MTDDPIQVTSIVLRDRSIPRYDVELGQVRLYKYGDTCAAPRARRGDIVAIQAEGRKPIYRLVVFAPSIFKEEMVLDIDSIYQLLGDDFERDQGGKKLDGKTIFTMRDGQIRVEPIEGFMQCWFVLRLGCTHPDRTTRLAVNLALISLVLGIISLIIAAVGILAR